MAAADIQQHLDNLKSQRFLAFVDCNFLGFDAGKEKIPDANLNNFYREFLGSDEARNDAVNRVVMLANTGTKPSLNLEKHGIACRQDIVPNVSHDGTKVLAYVQDFFATVLTKIA